MSIWSQVAKFDRLVKKFTAESFVDPIELFKARAKLIEVAKALKESIDGYSDQEKLNNWSQPWYMNARASYEEKLNKVNGVLLQLEARSASLQTTATADKV